MVYEALKFRRSSSSTGGSNKKDTKQDPLLLEWRKTLIQLYIKLGVMRLDHAILCLMLVLFLIPCVHRIIVWRESSFKWVFAPIMDIERPCPAPRYSTIGKTAGAGNNDDLKICLATLTDEKLKSKQGTSFLRKVIRWRNYDNILDLTWDSKQEYANKHGYFLYDGSTEVDVSRPVQWSKIKAVQHLLEEEKCNWVLWHDADTLFMNTNVRIEDILPSDPNKDLLVTEDTPNVGILAPSPLERSILAPRPLERSPLTLYSPGSPSLNHWAKFGLEKSSEAFRSPFTFLESLRNDITQILWD